MKAQKFLLSLVLITAAFSWIVGTHAQNLAGTPGATPEPGSPSTQVSPAAGAALTARLSVAETQPDSRKPVLRLSVENSGHAPVNVLRLRSGWLEYSGPDGWGIQIEGPGGVYQFPVYMGAVALPTQADIITLRPGESFGTLINVGDAMRMGGTATDRVSQTPGIYHVSLTFNAPIDKAFLRFLKGAGVLLQPVRSNTLEFTSGG